MINEPPIDANDLILNLINKYRKTTTGPRQIYYRNKFKTLATNLDEDAIFYDDIEDDFIDDLLIDIFYNVLIRTRYNEAES